MFETLSDMSCLGLKILTNEGGGYRQKLDLLRKGQTFLAVVSSSVTFKTQPTASSLGNEG